MNAISQTLIDPVAAPNVSSLGTSQPVPDNGVFAGMMAAQNLLSQDATQSVKNSQINPATAQTSNSSDSQQMLAAPIGIGLVGSLSRAVEAPHHDPISVASLSDKELPSSQISTENSVQTGNVNSDSRAVPSFFARLDGLDVSPRSRVTENIDAVCNTLVDNSVTNASDKTSAAEQAVQTKPLSDVQTNTSFDGKSAIELSQKVDTYVNAISGKVESHAQLSADQVVTEVVAGKQGTATKTPLTAKNSQVLLNQEDSKTSLGGTKETSKKEAAPKGVRIANEDMSPAAIAAATLNPMTNLSTQNATTNVSEESNSESSEKSVATTMGVGAFKGKKFVGAAQTGTADLAGTVEKLNGDVDAADDTKEAQAVPFAAVAQVKTAPDTRGAKQDAQEEISAEDSGIQAATAPVTTKGMPIARTVHGKTAAGKAKGAAADRGNAQSSNDDSAQGTSTFAAVVSSAAPVAAPQPASAPHAQVHSAFGVAEAGKNTAAFAGAAESTRTVQAADALSSGFSTTQPVQTIAEPGARNQQVEVGFHDGTLGWLSVRAASASDNGGLHLSVTGRSTDAAAAVDRMMPSLQHFLQEHDVRAHSVTYGSQSTAALPFVGGSMASSSFSQNMNDAPQSEQRSNSSGQQRSGSESGQQAFSQRDRSNPARVFPVSTGTVYEGAAQNQGLLSIRI